MLRFALDNNALQSLINSSEYKSSKFLFKQKVSKGCNQLYFTQLGFLELTTGVTSLNFLLRQKPITECLNICGSNLLATPYQYVVCDLGGCNMKAISEMVSTHLCHMKAFQRAHSFNELSPEWLALMEQFQSDLVELNRARLLTQDITRDPDRVDETAFELADRSSFIDSIIHNTYCRMLKREKETRIGFEMWKAHPSNKYYGMYWQRYAVKTLSSSFTSRRGDSVDSMLVMYLDRCDYLITQDGSLRDTVNDPNNEELYGRAINTDSFIEHVNSPFLPRRAPLKDSKYDE